MSPSKILCSILIRSTVKPSHLDLYSTALYTIYFVSKQVYNVKLVNNDQ